jgi:hypothetical protein
MAAFDSTDKCDTETCSASHGSVGSHQSRTAQSADLCRLMSLQQQHAENDHGAAAPKRVTNQERQRIEPSKVIQGEQVSAARQVKSFAADVIIPSTF